jgi:hypothetical protein
MKRADLLRQSEPARIATLREIKAEFDVQGMA